MKRLDGLVNYLYVGYIPNGLSVLCVTSAIGYSQDGDWKSFANSVLVGVFNATLGYLNFREYNKIKNALEEHGWDERLVKQKCYYFCQRHAARQAAKQTGYLSGFDDFMQREGHEWWHFLPKFHRLK